MTPLDELVQWFEAEDWSVEHEPGHDFLVTGYAGQHGDIPLYVRVRDAGPDAVVYSRAPVSAPPDALGRMAELLTRANYGMVIGNFELDLADGEIRYKTSLSLRGTALTPDLIRYQLIDPNIATMDQYLPAIMAVAYGGASPEDAVQQVEG